LKNVKRKCRAYEYSHEEHRAVYLRKGFGASGFEQLANDVMVAPLALRQLM
jgi:hypothetical protein